MSGPPIAVVLFVSLPLLVVWLFVLVDVVRQPVMPGWRKAAWILACTVFVPVQVASRASGASASSQFSAHIGTNNCGPPEHREAATVGAGDENRTRTVSLGS